MFNFIVKYNGWADGGDSFSLGRVFEYTEDKLMRKFKSKGRINLKALARLPTLFVSETTGSGNQIARPGIITRAILIDERTIRLEYAHDVGIGGIPNRILQDIAPVIGIADFQFMRTHWSVNDNDLYRILFQNGQPRRQRPRAFQITEYENVEPTLVSAMMPFHPSFDAVYATLKRVSEAALLRCRRADDIWENPAVMQDVVSLIDRSQIVVADCTGRNPNVFYEIGIAHTLGREVILITQEDNDIPFDLRHLRYVRYENDSKGLKALSELLRPRLEDLAQQPVQTM